MTIISPIMRWTRHECRVSIKNPYKVLVKKKESQGNVRLIQRLILKFVLFNVEAESVSLAEVTAVFSSLFYEQDNEISWFNTEYHSLPRSHTPVPVAARSKA